MLPVEVSIDTVEVLVEMDYISPDDFGDHDLVAKATARFLSDMAEAVTCHEITLDSW